MSYVKSNNSNDFIYNDVIKFWFSEEIKSKWFSKDPSIDDLIKNKFLSFYEKTITADLDSFLCHSPLEILALIITLDQFPRNMFRNHPKSFATDYLALNLTKYAISNKIDIKLSLPEQKMFLYMPLMHSEKIEDQELSVSIFSQFPNAIDFARRHLDIIKEFGRFPHRNNVLGRTSTEDELLFLKQPNSSF